MGQHFHSLCYRWTHCRAPVCLYPPDLVLKDGGAAWPQHRCSSGSPQGRIGQASASLHRRGWTPPPWPWSGRPHQWAQWRSCTATQMVLSASTSVKGNSHQGRCTKMAHGHLDSSDPSTLVSFTAWQAHEVTRVITYRLRALCIGAIQAMQDSATSTSSPDCVNAVHSAKILPKICLTVLNCHACLTWSESHLHLREPLHGVGAILVQPARQRPLWKGLNR